MGNVSSSPLATATADLDASFAAPGGSSQPPAPERAAPALDVLNTAGVSGKFRPANNPVPMLVAPKTTRVAAAEGGRPDTLVPHSAEDAATRTSNLIEHRVAKSATQPSDVARVAAALSFDERLTLVGELTQQRGAEFSSATALAMWKRGDFFFYPSSPLVSDVDSQAEFDSQQARVQRQFDSDGAAFARLYAALPDNAVRERLKSEFAVDHDQSVLDSANARIQTRLNSYLHFHDRVGSFSDREIGSYYQRIFARMFDRDQSPGTIDANFLQVLGVYEEKIKLRSIRDELAQRFPNSRYGRVYRDKFRKSFLLLHWDQSELRNTFDDWSGRYVKFLNALNDFPENSLGVYYRDKFVADIRSGDFFASINEIESIAGSHIGAYYSEVHLRSELDSQLELELQGMCEIPEGYRRRFCKWFKVKNYSDVTAGDVHTKANRLKREYGAMVDYFESLLGQLPPMGDYRNRFTLHWNDSGGDLCETDLRSRFDELLAEHRHEEKENKAEVK